ncbi:unnamed protein product [Bursaphelenchus okinawaensis]|uniref:tRNA (32-2'-O)-methyltransferase regulator THADA n=1 Tax=Bursaphelenchus okinawaensis TaxID=465554 RepID=A0A811JUQ6_9BILA|nr:unnamed protein product [Bursaphelenchus okinawaensis]CAG9084686.1 unnamed protein product [Bursaphelenchus okinawaensis]
MEHSEGLEGVKEIEKGFKESWKTSCCPEHEIFIKDFVLNRLTALYPDEVNDTYLHCLKRCLYLLQVCGVGLSLDENKRVRDIIHGLVAHRNDYISHCGIECLEAYLEGHAKTCQACGGVDCLILKDVQVKFSRNDFREKLCGRIMVLLCTWSNEYEASEDFVERSYRNLENTEYRNAALNFLVADLTISEPRRQLHLKYIKRILNTCNDYRLLGRLLSILFKNNLLSTWFFEHKDDLIDENKIEPQILVAESMITFSVGNSLTWDQLIDERSVRLAIHHGNDVIRLLVLKLLSCHPRMSLPIKKLDLELIFDVIVVSMTIESPAIRDPVIDCLKKLFARMLHLLQLSHKASEGTVGFYKTFLHNLHDVCVASLNGSENFNRRFFAFHVLRELHSAAFDVKVNIVDEKDVFDEENEVKQGSNATEKKEKISSYNKTEVKRNISCYEQLELDVKVASDQFFDVMIRSLDDSYEKCQDMAAALLLRSYQYGDKARWNAIISQTLANSTVICAKTQHGVVYKMKVITECCSTSVIGIIIELGTKAKTMIKMLQQNLQLISAECPVHTILNAMSAVTSKCNMQEVKEAVDECIIKVCFDVMEMVNPVLHSISPEGMVLDEEEEDGDDDEEMNVPNQVLNQKMQSQRLLVACWRTIKAVSEIFANIVTRSPKHLLQNDWSKHLPLILNYFWNQLTECRHRGAFEMASECFKVFCVRMKELYVEDGHELNPKEWLEDILETLNTGKGIHRLVSTRRSAGLPHLVTAILAAFQPKGKQDKNEALDRTMKQLLKRDGKSSEIKVHSANVLKAIISNKIFKNQISKYIEQALALSIERLPSSSWNLRNAYSQLFAAITLRIFGPQNLNKLGTGMSAFEFFTTYQSLYPLFIDILIKFNPQKLDTVDRATAVAAFLCHIKPTKLSSSDKFSLISFMYPLHYIAFTAHSDHTRTFAVKCLRCLFEVDSLCEVMMDEYLNMLEIYDGLPYGWVASLNFLVHHLVKDTKQQRYIDLLGRKYTETVEICLSKNRIPDLTIYSITTVYYELKNKGFNINLDIFENSWKNGHLNRCLSSLDMFSNLLCHTETKGYPEALENKISKLRSMEKMDDSGDCQASSGVSIGRTVKSLDVEEGSQKTLNTITTKLLQGEDIWNQLDHVILDQKVVELALNSLRNLLLVNEEKVIKFLAIFLQDENRNVRQKASSILSAHLYPSLNLTLFPRVQYALLCLQYPDLEDFVKERMSVQFDTSLMVSPSSNEQRIFEECSQNTFCEPKLLSFEANVVKKYSLLLL